MREFFFRPIRSLLLTVLALTCLTSFSQAQTRPTERTCAPDSPYEELHRANMGSLRLSLFMLSVLGTTESAPMNIEQTYESIADASVFSLANVLSLRADFIQNCTRDPETYYREIAANERFIRIFQDLLIRNLSLTEPFLEKLEKEHPELLSHGNGNYNKKILKRLKKWGRHGKDRKKDPLAIAARALLGKSVILDEHAIKPARIFKINPEFVALTEARPSVFYSQLDEESLSTKLDILSRFYLAQ